MKNKMPDVELFHIGKEWERVMLIMNIYSDPTCNTKFRAQFEADKAILGTMAMSLALSSMVVLRGNLDPSV